MRSPDEHRERVEDFLAGLELSEELRQLAKVVRYALAGGGKRIRPVLCLATAEAAGGDPDEALAAAAALELVHSFSLVHDDLPALDDDEQRRGRPTVHVRFGEAQAILAGDALLNEAFSLVLGYEQSHVGRELALATSGMIGGQYLDINGGREDQLELNRLKTARLFEASVGCGLWVAQVPVARQRDWRSFGAEFGILYQVVDDLLDGDGLVRERGRPATLELATATEALARAKLNTIDADTSVLTGLVDELVARVQQSSV
ncbi:MAG TPA: polyprenyl synthetase family protein [Gaiellaceae bacterium]|nr:polyprenyl synthetase family protein [Gaiellaceae bacterium]